MKNSMSELLKVEKPSRYFPVELNIIEKSFDKKDINVCLSYPDSYEVGMSNIGIRILYDIVKNKDGFNCDRIFAPMPDYENMLKASKDKITSVEYKNQLQDFDIVGFSFQYELLYTNMLTILDLSDISFLKEGRKEKDPFIIAGGPSLYNLSIIEKFADAIFIGEAEESLVEFIEVVKKHKNKLSRNLILQKCAEIEGVYIPGYSKKVKRRIVEDFDNSPYPVNWIVPVSALVHDRAYIEIMRGCQHGCRFCQAGYIYRPLRFKSLEKTIELSDKILDSTGYEEISLASLSTSDYPYLKELSSHIVEKYKDRKVSISLPSLRMDGETIKLLDEILKVRKTGLTFACEAGSQHLRDCINKKISREELFDKMEEVFSKGWMTVKLYFMLGLPFEKENELEETVELVKQCSFIAKKYGKGRASINVAFSTFVPKPFTPFQWSKMIGIEEIKQRIGYLKENIKFKNVKLKWHNAETSVLEGVFSRGDGKLANVIIDAWKNGARFDGWSSMFKFSCWEKAFIDNNIDYKDYLNEIDIESELNWDNIDICVKKSYLAEELDKASKAIHTEDCNTKSCKKCGVC
ncbi:MAG: radical SAM protein [Candidatus Muirbacterium halophilum]|nr:radical SAM protein [Candidatus Muirbacterium halophilum]MCK9475399.1 radical SAM protein [Candidatus Muirbacterium halophilum]